MLAIVLFPLRLSEPYLISSIDSKKSHLAPKHSACVKYTADFQDLDEASECLCLVLLMLVPCWGIIFWVHVRDITVAMQVLEALELHTWVLCSGHLYMDIADTYQDYLCPLSSASGLIKAHFTPRALLAH